MFANNSLSETAYFVGGYSGLGSRDSSWPPHDARDLAPNIMNLDKSGKVDQPLNLWWVEELGLIHELTPIAVILHLILPHRQPGSTRLRK